MIISVRAAAAMATIILERPIFAAGGLAQDSPLTLASVVGLELLQCSEEQSQGFSIR